MTPGSRRDVIVVPLVLWAGLMALLLLTIVYAYLPGAPARLAIGLAFGAAKGVLIALFFMQLRRAAGLVRLAALAGLVWATFLYLFSFADFLTR